MPVVEVDIETGRIEFLKYVAVHDCGTMVNPMTLAGHVRGGTAQGIGTAIYEHFYYDETGPQWLRQWGFGFDRLSYVDLEKSHITDDGLKHLSGLMNLQELYLDDTRISTKDWQRDGADWAVEARKVGIPHVQHFVECLDAEATESRLQRDRALATALGVTATPTFVTQFGIKRGVLTDATVDSVF